MFDKYVVEDNEVNRLNTLTQPEKSLELCKNIAEIVVNNELKNKIQFFSKKIEEIQSKPLLTIKKVDKNKYKF